MIPGYIKPIKTNILVQEVNISIVYFEIIDGQLNLVEEGSVNYTEYLHVERILSSEKFNVSVVLFVIDSLSEVGSDQVRVVSLWVSEFGEFSSGDHFEVSVELILDDFGYLVSC